MEPPIAPVEEKNPYHVEPMGPAQALEGCGATPGL